LEQKRKICLSSNKTAIVLKEFGHYQIWDKQKCPSKRAKNAWSARILKPLISLADFARLLFRLAILHPGSSTPHVGKRPAYRAV
jgi:hypothetical protein